MMCPKCDEGDEVVYIMDTFNNKEYICNRCPNLTKFKMKNGELNAFSYFINEKTSIYVNFFFTETTIFFAGKRLKTLYTADKSWLKKTDEEILNWAKTLIIFQ